MEEQINLIKGWLGAGSINFFGKPMSGKDTVGRRLAGDLGAKFLSSGDIIRAATAAGREEADSADGKLIPTDVFYDLILPYFGHADLAGAALVLSSVGRWAGEEVEVMRAAREGGHEIKVAVELELSDEEVLARREAAAEVGDREGRADDMDAETLRVRLQEFEEKTRPVLKHYDELGLLVRVNGEQSREAVYAEVVNRLAVVARRA